MNRPTARIIASCVTVILATGLLGVAAAPSQAAGQDAGLFGTSDPTYDGAYRQSIAMLALASADVPIPAPATQWLAGQQCLDGLFEAYRVSIRTACQAPDPANFTGPDSNSTALAAMALRASGRQANADRAIKALVAAQNADGGWGFIIGSPSDANSTGLALAALNGAPTTSALRSARSSARSYLATQQVACTKPGDFGLRYPPSPKANFLSSAQALIGIASESLPFTTPISYGSTANTRCPSSMKAKVAAYLSDLLTRTAGSVPSDLDPTQVDWNNTSSAVLGLAAARLGKPGVDAGVRALERHVRQYGYKDGAAVPAALGALILVADATGRDPRAFGTQRTNLVQVLLASMRR
jgi:hypothetical protein